jgi:hypothetical protein
MCRIKPKVTSFTYENKGPCEVDLIVGVISIKLSMSSISTKPTVEGLLSSPKICSNTQWVSKMKKKEKKEKGCLIQS